jgi:hypothetical protein
MTISNFLHGVVIPLVVIGWGIVLLWPQKGKK